MAKNGSFLSITPKRKEIGPFSPHPITRRAFYVPRMHQKKFRSNWTKLTFFDYLVQYLIEIGLAQGLPEGLET